MLSCVTEGLRSGIIIVKNDIDGDDDDNNDKNDDDNGEDGANNSRVYECKSINLFDLQF